jgi:acetyltransferase-like isoleucine patch superfamily enzyme
VSQYYSGCDGDWHETAQIHVTAVIVGDVKIGAHCRVDAFAVITGPVKLDERVHIGVGACIFGGYGVAIGKGSSLSPGAKIFTATDDVGYSLLASPQLLQRASKHGPVSVGAFSVIGSNSVVLPNSQIGEEVQIAALSMVRGRIPDNQVWGGTPARYIMDRMKLDREKML